MVWKDGGRMDDPESPRCCKVQTLVGVLSPANTALVVHQGKGKGGGCYPTKHHHW